MLRKKESSLWPGAIFGAALVVFTSQPATNAIPSWWDVACWFVPNAMVCPRPVKDPAIPAPFVPPLDVPPCGTFDGPCQ
jgi:hypothetical protein